MSRKKDNKRVLIPRGKRQSGSMRKRRNDYNSMPVQPRRNDYFHSGGYGRHQPQKKKPNGVLIAAVIIALIAFIIGAGIGVSLSFDAPIIKDSPSQHYENVTGQMSGGNVNQSNTTVYFDDDLDTVDYNANKTFNTSKSNNYY
jgi:hypothetical protein